MEDNYSLDHTSFCKFTFERKINYAIGLYLFHKFVL